MPGHPYDGRGHPERPGGRGDVEADHLEAGDHLGLARLSRASRRRVSAWPTTSPSGGSATPHAVHRIRITTAAIASSLALIGGGVSGAAHADGPAPDPCAKQQTKVDKAQSALERVTAVFERQKEKVADAREDVQQADHRSERAKARAELREARADKEKKAQQQRLAKAQERLDECRADEVATAADLRSTDAPTRRHSSPDRRRVGALLSYTGTPACSGSGSRTTSPRGRGGRAGHHARSPSSTRIAGSITSRTRVASSRIAEASPTPIIFISIIDSVAKIANTETITAAALVTTPAVSAMPRSTASPGRQPAVDVLADPAEHEHVVVHRQPDEHHEHEQRQPVDHEAGAGEVQEPAPPAVLEDQGEHAERRSDRGQVEHRGDERERARCGRSPP